jgi:5S rRNA maturation endonuclease (ribonuclease M5)
MKGSPQPLSDARAIGLLTDTDTSGKKLRWLLVVDNDAIRGQVERELRAVREAMEGCEEEIARHDTLDLPAFRQWMAVQCSDLLNERRLIEERIWGLRGRLAAIQGLTQYGVQNVAAAFFWFHEIEQNRAAIPPYVWRAWEELTVGRPGRQKTQGVEPGRFDEGRDDEDAFSDSREGEGGAFSYGSSESEPSEREDNVRHKSLYRKIALLLHPDLAGVLTKQELELWYQAQRAYAEQDVVALETILARCDRVGTNSLSLSELRVFVRQANVRLATLRQSIAIMSKSPGWRFLLLSPAEVTVRLRDVRRELEGVIRGLRREATTMENELARIGTLADRWVRRRKGPGKQLALEI